MKRTIRREKPSPSSGRSRQKTQFSPNLKSRGEGEGEKRRIEEREKGDESGSFLSSARLGDPSSTS